MSNIINMYDPTRDYIEHKTEYDLAINNVLEHGGFINGKEIIELEKKLASYVGVKHCITVANGTDAIQISLLALDIGTGDEVITVPHTWISTAEAIAITGAKPVFVDIEPDTFNINPNKIEEKINSNTKAILAVSLYGQTADFGKINEIANKYNIPVIEDAAQSFGARSADKKSGSLTKISTTSFFPSKPLGCYGDGGACFTDDDVIANKIRAIKNHGGVVRFEHHYIGMNSRLDTIQASILLVKLNHLDKTLEKRNYVSKYYQTKLAQLEKSGLIKLPFTSIGNYHVWAQFSILAKDKETRDTIVDELKKNKINVAIFYPKPLHTQKCFQYLGNQCGDYPVTENICDRIFNLPCYAELSVTEMDYICDTLIKILKE